MPRRDVAAEAADWYARLRAEDVSELEAVRFRAWLAGDPERRREFEVLDDLWERLKGIENSPEVLRARAAIAMRQAREAGRAAPRRQGRGILAAAAAVLIAIGTLLLIQHQPGDRYTTGIGEQRTLPLADGSVVTLNTSTEIRLRFSRERRGVELVRGQANFEVAKDASRPFVVTAGNRAVRAVGTQFDVYKTADKVTVTLIEGRVSVIPSDAPVAAVANRQRDGSGEILLNAGEQLRYGSAPGAVQVTNADLPRVEAWRARKLDFSDTPLSDAIAEANRYSATQVVLDAPGLASARISGTFDAGKNELFVEGLQAYFHLDVDRTVAGRIVLTSRR